MSEEKLYTLFIKRDDRFQPQETIVVTESELMQLINGERVKGHTFGQLELVITNE